MAASPRRVVIFPNDAGNEVRHNPKRWRGYLCHRLDEAGITYVMAANAEPVPLGNYKWCRTYDGVLTIEQKEHPTWQKQKSDCLQTSKN